MKPQHPVATACGLAIALLATPAIVISFRAINGENRSDLQAALREVFIFIMVAVLLWVIKAREELPLSSVGLRADRWGRSLLRGGVLALLMLAATVGLFVILDKFGIRLGGDDANRFHPSLWVTVLSMFRAGIAEELFYRGYAIERIQSLTGNAWVAALVPLTIFAAAHYRQGIGGIIATFVLGGVATLFYSRFRDLIANMTGHTLTDLVLNVGLPLVSGG